MLLVMGSAWEYGSLLNYAFVSLVIGQRTRTLSITVCSVDSYAHSIPWYIYPVQQVTVEIYNIPEIMGVLCALFVKDEVP